MLNISRLCTKIRRRIYYYEAFAFAKIILVIPYKFSIKALSGFFGKIAYYVACDGVKTAIENVELIKSSLKKDKGILFVAHAGNCEMTTATVAGLDVPVNVVAKKMYIDELNDMLVGYRASKKVNIIFKGASRYRHKAIIRGPVTVVSSGNFDKDVENLTQKATLFFGRVYKTVSGLMDLGS